MATTNYLWDIESDNILQETDDSNVTQVTYTNEPGQFGKLISQRRGSTTSTPHFDATGSTRQLTDSSQSMTDARSYTAFGAAVASTGSTVFNPQWAGEHGYYFDMETGVVNVRSRPYQVETGRWRSQDSRPPLGADDPNRYNYVGNNPITLSDPSGNKWDSDPPVVHPKPSGVANCCTLAFFLQQFTSQGTYELGNTAFHARFIVHAVFSSPNASGVNCHCCEYRQLISVWIDGRQHVPGRGVSSWQRVEDRSEFNEDTDASGRPSGHRKKYENTPLDEYLPTRADGCIYHLTDQPGYQLSKEQIAYLQRFAGITLEFSIHYRFKAQIIDVCQDREIESKDFGIDMCAGFKVEGGKFVVPNLVSPCGA